MLKDIIEERNKELDKCKICHGNGNNGADDALCLNCGGSGEEQKYSLNDFCIEFKDIIEVEQKSARERFALLAFNEGTRVIHAGGTRIDDMETFLDTLITETAQIVAREVLRKVREGVPEEVPSMPDLCIDSHEGWLRSKNTLLTHLQTLEKSLLDK